MRSFIKSSQAPYGQGDPHDPASVRAMTDIVYRWLLMMQQMQQFRLDEVHYG